MGELRTITVALVCPNDVLEERNAVEEAIEGLRSAAEKRGFVFVTRKWDDVAPGYYPRGVQSKIDETLNILGCDLVIAIFWMRYGVVDAPPYSRTAREVLTAMEGKRQRGAPELIAYFSQRLYMPQSEEDAVEQSRVLAFKNQLQRAEVRTKDFDPATFGMIVVFDVLDLLDKFAFSDRPTQELSCRLTSSSVAVRPEGYTESVSDIRLIFTGKSPSASETGVVLIDITVFLSASITNRITADTSSDVELFSNKRGTVMQAVLRTSGTQPSQIFFSAVALGAPDTHIDEVLTIRGIRADAEIFGRGVIDAFVEVKLAGTEPQPSLLRQQITVASIGPNLNVFSAQPMARSRVVFANPADMDRNSVRAFTLTVASGFPGSFRTREQEGSGNSMADSGTIIAAFVQGIPSESRMLVTATEIPDSVAMIVEPVARTTVVQTRADGSRTEQLTTAVEMIWDRQVPMVPLEPSARMATWEVVTPSSSRDTLTFGIALVGPKDLAAPRRIEVFVGLAPFYTTPSARQPSATLPIPRFIPGTRVVEVTLE